MVKMLSTLFFDFDHTLADTDGADARTSDLTMARAAARRPELDTTALAAHYAQSLLDRPFPPPDGGTVAAWRTDLLAEALADQGTADVGLARDLHDFYYATRVEQIAFFPGVSELLHRLRQDYTLIVITNGAPSIQHPKLAACNVGAAVDDVVVSGDFGVDKPDPAIFHHACALAGCSPAEALHVGDNLQADIAGGIAAALAATVWVSGGQSVPADGPQPSHTVDAATDLPAVLAEFRAATG
jgi:HAD superfamily hydrolase (TIGR01549 family)